MTDLFPHKYVLPSLTKKSNAPPRCLFKPQEALFSTLIPDSSAKALSRYTAMVDSKTREILDKLAMATDNARIKLKVGLLRSSHTAKSAQQESH